MAFCACCLGPALAVLQDNPFEDIDDETGKVVQLGTEVECSRCSVQQPREVR
ncbi:MAG: hypothetical protein NUW01_02680 [Gemmatimonadaceae bacterium]|nr:hypothetical protein [Gemmatimonadaceae bacterium]